MLENDKTIIKKGLSLFAFSFIFLSIFINLLGIFSSIYIINVFDIGNTFALGFQISFLAVFGYFFFFPNVKKIMFFNIFSTTFFIITPLIYIFEDYTFRINHFYIIDWFLPSFVFASGFLLLYLNIVAHKQYSKKKESKVR